MNVNLGAPYEAILKRIVERGYAGNQTEAIRQALTEYERKLREEEEMMLVQKGVEYEMQKMKGRRWKTHEEVFKKAGL
jgi:Arc/MetJ-type ribon-helix-helix transcriptional regulator